MLGTVFVSHCEVNISEYQSDLSPTMNLNCTHFTFPAQITLAGDTRRAVLGSWSCRVQLIACTESVAFIFMSVTIIFIRRREGWIMNVVWQVVDVVVDILVVVIIMMNRVKCPLVIIQLSHHHRVSAVSHPVAITCFRAPFTARAKLYLFLLRPVSFVVTQCMTFCNCCCSEARAIYHSPVIPQTAVMFLNCGINFRSVPPLTSACCSCAFAVRWTWKYFHHWFHAMMRQFNTFLHMGPPFCPQFWIKSDFSRRGPLGTLTDLPFRLASAPPLAWLPRFVDPAECRGRAAVGDRRQQEIELRGQQIRMISDKGSGWCPAPRLSCYRNRYSSAVNYCCRHRAGSREPRPRRGGEKPLQCKAD